MRKPGTIFLLAVMLGALSAAMVYRYLRAQQQAIETARRAAGGATTELVVANDTIPIGARIEASQVRSVRWPVDLVPEGAVRAPEGVIGSVARTMVERNQPLVQAHLIQQGAGLLPLLITEGMRGMSVKVDSVTGVSGFITPNSRVDVLVAGSPDGHGDEERSKLILQNIRVLATGKSIEQRDEKPVEVPTVTLLVSPEDAEKLTLAARQEPVRLALRNYRDEDLVSTPGMTTKALFEGGARASAPTRDARPARTLSVEVVLGEKVTRQPVL